MKRILIILAAIVVLAAAIAAAAVSTPPGRRLLALGAQSWLSQRLNAEVVIGALDFPAPTMIVVRGLTAARGGRVFFIAEEARITWRPTAAIEGALIIDEFDLVGGALLERPQTSPSSGSEFSFPQRFPQITIAAARVADFRVAAAVAGRDARFDASLSARSETGAFQASFDLAGDEGRDRVTGALRLDPSLQDNRIDIVAHAPEGGALATALALGGPLDVQVHGAGPASAFTLDGAARIGAYGDAHASTAGAIGAGSKWMIRGSINFGERLGALARHLGPDASYSLDIQAQHGGANLTLHDLSTDAGALKGALELNARGDARFRGRLRLAERADARLRAALGDDLGVEISRGGDERGAVEAKLFSETSEIAVRNLIVDATARRSGDLSWAIDAPAPLSGKSAIFIETWSRVELTNLSAHVGDAATLIGRASGGDGEIEIDGVLTIRADALAPIAPALAPKGAFSGPASFKIKAGQVTARAEFSSADLSIAGRGVSRPEIELDVDGTIEDWRARIAVVTRDDGVRAALSARGGADGAAAIPSFRMAGRTFEIVGAGAYDPGAKKFSLSATHTGASEIWPMVKLGGEASLAGAVALGAGAAHDVTLRAARVGIGGAEIADLSASLKGPAAGARLAASARGINAARLTIADISLAALIDGPRRTATVSALTGEILGETWRLARPATIARDDRGFAFAGLDLRADEAHLTLDGALSPRRWVIKAAARGAPLRSGDVAAALDFDVDLDTDRKAPGRGSFALRSSMEGDAPLSFAGALAWDGKRLIIADAAPDDSLAFNLDLPLRLSRGAKISARMDGALTGVLGYEGRVESLAALLPPALQSLEGALAGRLSLAGDVKRPKASGEIALRDGVYTDFVTGLTIVDVNGVIAGDGADNTVRLSALGRGPGQRADSIKLEGTLSLGARPMLDAQITLDGAEFSADSIDELVADGDVRLKGSLQALELSGDVVIDRLEASLQRGRPSGMAPIDVRFKGAQTAAKPRAPRPLLSYAVSINAPGDVRIAGRGLLSEWRAALRAVGQGGEPNLLGRLDLIRGSLALGRRNFQLESGVITFDALKPNDPRLDIVAAYDDPGVIAAEIRMEGRASAFTVTLSSSPAFPPDEIIARVLFGRPISELAPGETLQIARALGQLNGLGSGDAARRALGLDALNVDFDPETGAGSLEVGKTVAKGLFVSAGQDSRGQDGSVRARYDAPAGFSVETELKQNGDQTVSANWSVDF